MPVKCQCHTTIIHASRVITLIQDEIKENKLVQHEKKCIMGAEEILFWLKLKIFTRLTLWAQESSRAGPRRLHKLTKATALINEKNADARTPSITHLTGAQSQSCKRATAHGCTLPEASFSPYLTQLLRRFPPPPVCDASGLAHISPLPLHCARVASVD